MRDSGGSLSGDLHLSQLSHFISPLHRFFFSAFLVGDVGENNECRKFISGFRMSAIQSRIKDRSINMLESQFATLLLTRLFRLLEILKPEIGIPGYNKV